MQSRPPTTTPTTAREARGAELENTLVDQRLLRQLSTKLTGLKDRALRAEGSSLLDEGNYIRTHLNKDVIRSRWPLCVPRVEVSLPGCTLSDMEKQRIYVELARVVEQGQMHSSVKSHFVRRQREEVQSRTRSSRTTRAGCDALRDARGAAADSSSANSRAAVARSVDCPYSPFQLRVMREQWKRKCKKWFEAHKWLSLGSASASSQSSQPPPSGLTATARTLEASASRSSLGNGRDVFAASFDGAFSRTASSLGATGGATGGARPSTTPCFSSRNVCKEAFNSHPLRHVSTAYPHLGFAPPGVAADTRAASARTYENDTLRPMRRELRYQMAQQAQRGHEVDFKRSHSLPFVRSMV